MNRILRILPAVSLGLCLAVAAQAQTKLLRFPDIQGDRVAFCHAGDIWTAPAAGGLATRLTSHPGLEQFPKFSPDGRWIAFTGQYDGDEQVYVVPAEGGVPRQLTFYPARGPNPPRGGWDNQVMGWTRDGKSVLFNTLRDAGGEAERNLYTVPLEGGHESPLPMYTAGAGDYSPDGARMVYSPLFRDFRTWKRYEGGWAQDLWICDLKTLATENITHHPRTDRDPMWVGNAIIFSSDRDGTLNLYRYDLASKAIAALTHSTKGDVRWPSTDHGTRVVYELDGELQVMDLATLKDVKLAIQVPNDGVAMRPARIAVERWIEDFALAPQGERALFVARGDVFTAPIEFGATRNLTNSSTAHDKWARWSPDGRQIAYISDRSGEDQLWVIPQDGMSEPRQLTTTLEGMLYAPAWSPDGKHIALSDKEGRIHVVTVADRRIRIAGDEERGQVDDYAWSPGGSYLAFSLSHPSGFRSIRVWSAADGSTHQVTDELFNSFEPAWDPDGNFLYYLSDRDYAPQQTRKEANYASSRNTGIFALALRKDVKHPFPPRSDEVALGGGDARDEGGEKKPEAAGSGSGTGGDAAKEKKPARRESKPITIDFDGIRGRVARVPVTAENYRSLAAIKGHLLYVRAGAGFNGRDSYVRPALVIYSLKDREESVLSDAMTDYAVSEDGSKVLISETGKYSLMDAKPKTKDKKTVATRDLAADRVPAQEWATIFDEVWRRYRDFFYVKNMHGYDWKAIGEQYKALLPHVAHRWDLTYLMNEMISELNCSHLYLTSGDFEVPPRAPVGLAGARFDVDQRSGRYRIARLYRGHNEEPLYRSPLTEVGVDARVGDYILAIDGVELTARDNIYQRLRNRHDPVTLTLNYPQIRKDGLIVDVRSNGGGNVSQQIIERLRRQLLGVNYGSTRDDIPGTYPSVVFTGPMVCLLNETSASDGDIFPYMFRKAGLGPLIGKRSWGGVVGISGRGPLIDGGDASVPLSGLASAEGQYVIEGHGVDPDIVVENDPVSVAAGRDPQLERGIAEVLKLMQTHPAKLPARPPDPVKTK